MNARRVGRLGVLAVGLGIGAAWAHTPVASADTSSDWLSSIDNLLSGAVPAPTSGADLAISFDGVTLFHEGSATATTTAGDFDFAIASGAGSIASATGGFGDSASASGAGSIAEAGGGFGDYASATGGAEALAGDTAAGATGNNFDSASASGIDNVAIAGNDPAYGYSDTTGSSFDSASAGGGTAAGPDEALAGFNGSGDTAHASGQEVYALSGFSSNAADPANNDTANVYGNPTTPTFDYAIAGSDSGTGGSGDTAFVVDPSGTVGSTAIGGEGFNYDLAGVFGDGLHATANTANFLVDILPAL